MTVTRDLVDRFFESIPRLTDRGRGVVVDLFGGEPLLEENKEIVGYILDRVRANGHRVAITTNTVDFDSYSDMLRQFEDLINSFRVTFMGNRMKHDQERIGRHGEGTYDQTMGTIKHILASFPKANVLINVLLTKDNVGTVKELMSELDRNGILSQKRAFVGFGKVQFRGDYDHGYADRVLEQKDYYPTLLGLKRDCNGLITDDMIRGSEVSILSAIYKYWIGGVPAVPRLSGCDAVTPGVYCFYPDGRIYPCVDIVGTEQFSVGTYHSGLALNERHKQWREHFPCRNEKCMACKYVGMCNGGCMTTNISKNGDINDTVCLDMEGSVRGLILSLAKLGVLE